MAPDACRTQGRSRENGSSSGNLDCLDNYGQGSSSIIWVYENNGFEYVGPKSDIRIPQYLVNLRISCTRVIVHILRFFFVVPNSAQSWNTYLRKSSQDLRTSPKGSTDGPRSSKESLSGSKELPKTSSGDTFYIFRLPINCKAAVSRIR